MKDVVEKNKLIDASLLEKLLKFLISNIGSLISAKKIADFLTSQGTKVTHNTILCYGWLICMHGEYQTANAIIVILKEKQEGIWKQRKQLKKEEV